MNNYQEHTGSQDNFIPNKNTQAQVPPLRTLLYTFKLFRIKHMRTCLKLRKFNEEQLTSRIL